VSTGDLDVNGVVVVVDHGSLNERWGLTVLAEGFTRDELSRFRAAVDELVPFLQTIEPFASSWSAVSVVRVETISRESGLADVGVSHDTAFSAQPGLGSRTLDVNWDLAEDAAELFAPGSAGILLLVNDTQVRGVATATVAVTTLQPAWLGVAVHELGHQAGGLADEYSYPGDRYHGPEPGAANVTTTLQWPDLKWGHLVDAATLIPTLENPGCVPNEHWPSPVAPGVVGIFEGCYEHCCGIARPEHDCLMRNFSADRFCRVCIEELSLRLSGYLPP
jgi:hypothetical protein